MKTVAILALCFLVVICVASDAATDPQPAGDNPAEEGLFVEREQASTVVRQKRAAGQLSLHMMDINGIIAAYTAYYGPIPY
uniref:Osteocalcin-like n=1 Tax=Neolamprologus brichardi TaxID=32507 RepID=A0A3Q4G142_NEOBR